MNKISSEAALLHKLKTYLSYRAHSEYELKCKLIKHFDEKTVTKALKLAKQSQLLPKPEEIAQQLANELHRKKKGWLFIQATLKKKQLPLIPKEEEQEEEKCRWWLNKKISYLENLSEDMTKKMYRFLSYKGFEGFIIKKVIHEYKKSKY